MLMLAPLCLLIAGNAISRTGCIDKIPPETPAKRQARHARIAQRRAGPVVIVHRGASAFAPENTLEAYAAAMDYGADGCEIDPRRTADGVIVLFHDDMLENLTNGFGSVNQLTYYQLLGLKRRSGGSFNIPTLAALLELARQRAMLLHLDLKEPGLTQDIAKMLDEADMWDAVVSINTDNAGDLLTNPKFKPLSYKAPGLYEDKSDVDIEATKSALAQPGNMIIVDDPRVAAQVLERPAHRPVPMPKDLTKDWPPSEVAGTSPPDEPSVPAYVVSLAKTANSLNGILRLLDTSEADRTTTDGTAQYQRQRREKMLARAWAAERVGEIGKKTDRIVKLLEFQVEHRSLDRNWRFQGMDGAMAARVLGKLGATESVPLLARKLMTVDPRLSKAADPEYPNTPIAFFDWRIKDSIVEALGLLVCDQSKRVLMDYVAMDRAKALTLGVPIYANATKSLLRQKLAVAEIEKLLRSDNPEVRGTAVLECLDHPTKARTAALKAAAPWALKLPRACHFERSEKPAFPWAVQKQISRDARNDVNNPG
jgi:HEAT repeat protein